MGKFAITSVNPKEVMLENILAYMTSELFSKTLSARIVGGEATLHRLIADGKIEVSKPSNTQNGKWYCNAAQVLQHCRCMKERKRKLSVV